MHIKKQIRDQLVATLKGSTGAGNNVFASKVYPITKQQLPAICVYTMSEDINYLTMSLGGARQVERQVDIGVDIFVRANDSYDDELDALQVEVEAILYNNPLAALRQLDLRSTSLSLSSEGEQMSGRLAMTYTGFCYTVEGDAETST